MNAATRLFSSLSATLLIWLSVPALAGTTDSRPVLRIAHNETYLALTHKDEAIRLALEQSGIRVEFVEVPLPRALDEASLGEIVDADPARPLIAIQRYSNLVIVPVPVHRFRLSAFIRDGSPEVTGWESLRNIDVSTYSGSTLVDTLVQQNHLSRVEFSDTFAGVALRLALHRADVAILPFAETHAFLDTFNIQSIRASGPPLADELLYFSLNKRNAALVPQITDAFRRYKLVVEME